MERSILRSNHDTQPILSMAATNDFDAYNSVSVRINFEVSREWAVKSCSSLDALSAHRVVVTGARLTGAHGGDYNGTTLART